MTLTQILKAFDSFFASETKKVLILKGPWGAGKSHFVRDYLKTNPKPCPDIQYYVSLFGLSTLQEVRETIDANLSIRGLAAGKALKQALALPEIKGGGLIKLGASIFWTVTREKFNVVVFDDLERALLPRHQVLGLASSLAENTKSKIVIIFNEDKLDDESRKKFNEYREKIVDVEILFNPTAKELVEKYLDESQIKDKVTEVLEKSRSSNIRLITKVNSHLGELKSLLRSGMVILTSDELVHASKIICLAYLVRIPLTIELIQSSAFGLGLKAKRDKLTEDEAELQQLSSSLDLFPSRPFDKALLEIIQNGFCSESTLSTCLETYKRHEASDAYNQSYSQVFSPYYDNFLGTVQDIFAASEKLLDKYSGTMRYDQFLQVIDFLRDLKYPKSMDSWIERQLKSIVQGDPEERINVASKFPPCKARSEFIRKERTLKEERSPYEIIRFIARSGGWTASDTAALNRLSKKDLKTNILNDANKDFIDCLSRLWKMWESYTDGSPANKFALKLRTILNQASHRSHLDKLRITNLFPNAIVTKVTPLEKS